MKKPASILFVLFLCTQLGFAQITKEKIIDKGGSGPYNAIAVSEKTLPDFVVYRPKNLKHVVNKEGKLPVVVWANGGCMNSSIHVERFLTEVASHGYVIVAIGELQMTLEERVHQHTPDTLLLKAIEWTAKQAKLKGGDYYKMVDLKKIAAAGHSCGGAQVMRIAGDKQITTYMMFNSGMGDMTMAGASKESLKNLHGPVIYLVGGVSDIACNNALLDYERITHVPVAFANLIEGGHGGTFAQEFGGSFAQMTLNWLDWQFKGKDNSALFLQNDLTKYIGWEMKTKNF